MIKTTFVLLAICFMGMMAHAQFSDQSVQTVAALRLRSFLDKIPSGRETQYGFYNRTEYERAITGTPMRLYTINPDALQNGIIRGKKYLIAMDEWRIPILVDGQYRSLLTVAKGKNGLKAVALGGEGLAKEVAEIATRHPKGRKAILRLHELQADFMVLDSTGRGMDEGVFHPLKSARLAFDRLPQEKRPSYSEEELLPHIHRKYLERSGRDQ